jgi:hypothetical protein
MNQYTRARFTLAVALFAAAGCSSAVAPDVLEPIDAGAYSACTGPVLGSADGAAPGSPCLNDTVCWQTGQATPFGTDRVGICTRSCTTDEDCPQLPRQRVTCTYIVGRPQVPYRCTARCADTEPFCPPGTMCSYSVCVPPL